MPITKTKPTERELIIEGLSDYLEGKDYKQPASRAFLAGIKFYKESILQTRKAD